MPCPVNSNTTVASWALGLALLLLTNTAFAQEQPPARVRVALVEERMQVATTRFAGELTFDRVAAVSTEVAGLITEQHLRAGNEVSKGDLLLELNSDLLQKDLEIKRYEQAQVATEKKKFHTTLKRLEQLIERDSASRQVYEDALYDNQALTQRMAEVEEEIAHLKLRIEKHRLYAPFDGLVLEKLKEQGEWIKPGDAAGHIAANDSLVVKAAISEDLIRFQSPGRAVPIDIPALGEELEGTILMVEPVADRRSRTLIVKISLPYRPGMAQYLSAGVRLPVSKERLLRVFPRDALIRAGGKVFVYTVKEGKAAMLPVNVMARSGKEVFVEQPTIRIGMVVVVDGNDRLRPDQPVQIIEE